MRDINRIDDIAKALVEIWKQYPDMRLGQLITNVIADPALYYIEDKDLIKRLRTFYLERKD